MLVWNCSCLFRDIDPLIIFFLSWTFNYTLLVNYFLLSYTCCCFLILRHVLRSHFLNISAYLSYFPTSSFHCNTSEEGNWLWHIHFASHLASLSKSKFSSRPPLNFICIISFPLCSACHPSDWKSNISNPGSPTYSLHCRFWRYIYIYNVYIIIHI